MQNEIKIKNSNIEFLQQTVDELESQSTAELNIEMKTDLKQLKNRHQNLIDSVSERINKLEKLINDLRQFDEDYMRMLNSLNKIEAHAQIEHHSSSTSGLSHGKSLEAQMDILKQMKFDLDNLHPSMRKLNEQSEKYLYEMNRVNILSAANTENKFQIKLKEDIIAINEKFKQLYKNHAKTLSNLEVNKYK